MQSNPELQDIVDSMPDIVHWNVLFLQEPREHIWDWFTDKYFRHVVAFGWANDRFIVYDVHDRHSSILVLNDDQFDIWYAAVKPKVTAHVKVPTQARAPLRARFGLWCVTAIKHLLGFRSGALRPQALYRDLIKSGKAEYVADGLNESQSPS